MTTESVASPRFKNTQMSFAAFLCYFHMANKVKKKSILMNDIKKCLNK